MKLNSKFGGVVLGALFMVTSSVLAANGQSTDNMKDGAIKPDLVAVSVKKATAPVHVTTAWPKKRSGTSSSDWNGFYVGGYVGGTFNRSSANTSTVFSPTGYFATTSPGAISTTGSQKIDPSGFTGGGTIGYNYQSGSFVVGAEADFGALTTNKSISSTAPYPCCPTANFTVTQSMKTNWLFTARPRVGFTAGKALFYATGGLALTDFNYQARFTDTFASATENGGVKKTRAGWTLGGGAEYKVNNNWSIKGEYLYADFNRASTTSTNLMAFTPPVAYPSNPFTHSSDLKLNTIRFGVNFHF